MVFAPLEVAERAEVPEGGPRSTAKVDWTRLGIVEAMNR